MKQLNLNSPIFAQLLKYAVVALLAILVFSWFKSCGSGPAKVNTQKIIIPAVSGKFEPIKPDSKPIEVINTPVMNKKQKDGTVYITNPLNEKLLKENDSLKNSFSKLKTDSLKQNEYEKAIALNSFSSKFEDNNVLININGTVRGEVQSITPSYTVKHRELDVKIKETKLRVLAGGSFGISKEFNQVAYKAGIDLQNSKGNIISAEYLQVGSNSFYMVGYKKSILNIKR